MNIQFELRYLAGGDSAFGPNYGGASVLTLTRTGYLAQCPNVGRLLQNLQFTTGGESEMMQAMVAGKQPPEVAARAWLRAHPTTVAPSAAPLILAGITQCIMLSLSMVVIGALVGAGGLGVPVDAHSIRCRSAWGSKRDS
jgi:hypothetical protein